MNGVLHWINLKQYRMKEFWNLKLSYDGLGEVEKKVFLDLACFFNGVKLGDVKCMLLCFRGIQPEYAIGVLIDKSLIKIKGDRVTIHDLIENIGKEIVRQESKNEPGKRSRLWFYQDILHVLQRNTGTNKVEAIILDSPKGKKVQWSGTEFMRMKNLKMLVIKNACFSKCPKYLPDSLRVLEWKGYPFKSLPYSSRPTELVYLDLSNSYCELLLPFGKKFESLSSMNFTNCKYLQQIPDLSGVFNLTELWLDNCMDLIKIHDSIGLLNKLRKLSAMRCKNLKILPSGLRLISLEHLNLFGCSSLQSFPEILDKMEKLRTLDLDRTAIAELPLSIHNLIGLEILSMEECSSLKQLPSCICMLPNLWTLTANFCEGMRQFKICDGGEEASLECLAMSSKLEYFQFSNCNLSDGSIDLCLSYLPNVICLDLSFNSLTTLPACIKQCHHLRYLLLDNCKQLQHIVGIPSNLEKFSAICCTSLTKSSESNVLNQALYLYPGKRMFILPGKEMPGWLDNYGQGNFMSFWIRNEFPTIFLWLLVVDDHDSLYNCTFSVHVNNTKLDISSEWLLLSTIKTNHLYLFDLKSIIRNTEFSIANKWKQVKVSIESNTVEMEREIYFAVHVCRQQNNSKDIQFMEPRTYLDCMSWKNILKQLLDREGLEDATSHQGRNLRSWKALLKESLVVSLLYIAIIWLDHRLRNLVSQLETRRLVLGVVSKAALIVKKRLSSKLKEFL